MPMATMYADMALEYDLTTQTNTGETAPWLAAYLAQFNTELMGEASMLARDADKGVLTHPARFKMLLSDIGTLIDQELARSVLPKAAKHKLELLRHNITVTQHQICA